MMRRSLTSLTPSISRERPARSSFLYREDCMITNYRTDWLDAPVHIPENGGGKNRFSSAHRRSRISRRGYEESCVVNSELPAGSGLGAGIEANGKTCGGGRQVLEHRPRQVVREPGCARSAFHGGERRSGKGPLVAIREVRSQCRHWLSLAYAGGGADGRLRHLGSANVEVGKHYQDHFRFLRQDARAHDPQGQVRQQRALHFLSG